MISKYFNQDYSLGKGISVQALDVKMNESF